MLQACDGSAAQRWELATTDAPAMESAALPGSIVRRHGNAALLLSGLGLACAVA